MTAAVVHGLMLAAATATGHASAVDWGTFGVAAAIVLSGAIGVVIARNPVHGALMLVMTLFGIAVLFVLQRDDFLAAVQVIVYAGAIVVLFLFVIMFLGVDREENIAAEPLRGQRPLAVALVALGVTGLLLLGEISKWTTGAPSVAGSTDSSTSNVAQLGTSVYTTYLFPFEITSALLVIAVVGAVALARRPPMADLSRVPVTDLQIAEGGAGPDGASGQNDQDGQDGQADQDGQDGPASGTEGSAGPRDEDTPAETEDAHQEVTP
ncbi:MAG TPA: NADH-quinone oxidoreductase subunit J [Acidimicrobiales bacterium]|jgi:NADH-quinone oxidoreductase subunit J|nr:NADH-quinone oxidoreductase subunit J [Acidimicrobiales bacterium]